MARIKIEGTSRQRDDEDLEVVAILGPILRRLGTQSAPTTPASRSSAARLVPKAERSPEPPSRPKSADQEPVAGPSGIQTIPKSVWHPNTPKRTPKRRLESLPCLDPTSSRHIVDFLPISIIDSASTDHRLRYIIDLEREYIEDYSLLINYLIEPERDRSGCVAGYKLLNESPGQFGFSYMAIRDPKINHRFHSGIKSVVKVIDDLKLVRNFSDERLRDNLLHELWHPGLIQVDDVAATNHCTIIGMEHSYRNMRHLIGPTGKCPPRFKLITFQILDALKYLHSRQIIHGNLKPNNVLIDSNPESPRVKLTDYYYLHLYHQDEIWKQKLRKPDPCMAPEILRSSLYDHGIDIWSLGTLTYLMVTGEYPFNDVEDYQEDEQNFERIFRRSNMFFNTNFKNFLRAVLAMDRDARPTASEAQAMEWFVSDEQLVIDIRNLHINSKAVWLAGRGYPISDPTAWANIDKIVETRQPLTPPVASVPSKSRVSPRCGVPRRSQIPSQSSSMREEPSSPNQDRTSPRTPYSLRVSQTARKSTTPIAATVGRARR